MNFIDIAKKVIATEVSGLVHMSQSLDHAFNAAVDVILSTSGRTIICGMGKSGIIGKKIAASFASTGTPSFFMHPGEAFHGDLGMVKPEDVFIAISNSGETDEVLKLLPFLKDNGNYLISFTGNENSTLAKNADCHLNVAVPEEACPLQLAPTTSTTASLVMGDALTIALMEARQFRPENFARFHPGGSLGRRLLSRVDDEMVVDSLPVVSPEHTIIDVITTINDAGLGLAVVEKVSGYSVITDGDIRRALSIHKEKLFEQCANALMSDKAVSVVSGTRVEDAINLMQDMKITALLVTENDALVGIFKK